MASASVFITESFLSQAEGVRAEIRARFSRYREVLRVREAALLSELDELVASYRGEGVREQIQDLNRMKETMKITVQRNENQDTIATGVAVMDARIKELRLDLDTVKERFGSVELEWDGKLEQRLSGLGRIEVLNHQELIGADKCGALDTRNVKLWNVREGEILFRNERDCMRTVAFPHPKEMCYICLEDDSGLQTQCSHFFCPECLLEYAWIQIKSSNHEIRCPECCLIISVEDVIKFGLPNEDEKQFLTTALSVNFCESQDIELCPNCSSYCQRLDSSCPRMECIVCIRKGLNFSFCWYCLEEWRGESKLDGCWNSKCKSKEIKMLRDSPKIQFVRKGKVVSIPKLRACPQCFTIIEFSCEYSSDTLCQNCKTTFCFICLVKINEGSLRCNFRCTPAPVQTKLRN